MTKKLSVAATALAGVVLCGALVYYNFIDKEKTVEGVAVGELCPDFTVNLIKAQDGGFEISDENYNLREHNGKVRVINFWATWCSACKHELPYFNDFAVAYPEVEVVAVCGASGGVNIVENWMNDPKEDAQAKSWADYQLTFGFYGPEQKVYEDLGGTGFWPMTVIVDEEGIIRFTGEVEMDFDKLMAEVEPLLND